MMIDFDSFIMLIFAIIYLGIILFLRIRFKKEIIYLFFFTVFYVYLVSVIKYTQFPIYLSENMHKIIGQNVWKNMNLIPLYSLGYKSINTSIMNVVLTIPFGFGLPFIVRYRFLKVLFIGIIFNVVIEITQLVIALITGFTFRIVDINDVIFNSIGVIIGYFLFIIFVCIIHFIIDKWTIEQNIFLKYIYERK